MSIKNPISVQELDALSQKLRTCSLSDAHSNMSEISVLLKKYPEQESIIAEKISEVVVSRFVSAPHDLGRFMWGRHLSELVRILPISLEYAFKSTDPNVSYVILKDLPDLVEKSPDELNDQMIRALLLLLQDPVPESNVGGKLPIDMLNHDPVNDRYKFRMSIASVLTKAISRIKFEVDDWLLQKLKEIYESAPSQNVSRAVLVVIRANSIPTRYMLACIEYHLHSNSEDVVRELGVTLNAVASRIATLWTYNNTILLIERFKKSEWLARSELARGFSSMIREGTILSTSHTTLLTMFLCERNKYLHAFQAAERELIGAAKEAAKLSNEMMNIDRVVRAQLFDAIKNAIFHFDSPEAAKYVLFLGEMLENPENCIVDNENKMELEEDMIDKYVPKLFDLAKRVIEINE